jgi:hypothetical protein
MKAFVLLVINQGPKHPIRTFGYCNVEYALRRATQFAWSHGTEVDIHQGDANAHVLYVDASRWYERVQS